MSRRNGSRRSVHIHKANGVLHPRVQKVRPERFGIVCVDCAKARSKWMLADFYGKTLGLVGAAALLVGLSVSVAANITMREMMNPPRHTQLTDAGFRLIEHDEFRVAESFFLEALDGLLASDPKNELDRSVILVGLGAARTGKGDAADAERILREAVAIRRDLKGADAWLTASAESTLADCLVALNQLDEAGTLHRHSFPILESEQGANRDGFQIALERMARFYDKLGKPAIAEDYRQRLERWKASKAD